MIDSQECGRARNPSPHVRKSTAWVADKLSRVAAVRGRIGWRGYTVQDLRDDGPLVVGAAQIDRRNTLDLSKRVHISTEKFMESPEIQLSGGDIIAVKVGATIGRVALIPDGLGEATINPNVVIIRPTSMNGRFLFYSLQSPNIQKELHVTATAGAQDAINQSFLKRLPILVPPLTEQSAIADFLDRKTAAIDELIAKKDRLIELLNEKRQALITQAVTKGLDPSVPMKNSGIPWLGEIPAHWEVWPLRRAVKKFVDYRGKTPVKADDGIPLITATAVRNDVIDHSRCPEYVTEETYRKWMVRGFPKRGDVVFTTEGATFGEAAQIENETIALAQRLILFKVDEGKIANDYLFRQFLSGFGRAEQWSNVTGSTALGIKADRLKGIRVVLPPLVEQKEICDLAAHYSNKSRVVIDATRKQIQYLKEYRQALISAAVSGKIDVRNEVAS